MLWFSGLLRNCVLVIVYTGVPKTSKNARIQAGCAGQAGAVTRLPSTWALSSPSLGSTQVPPQAAMSNELSLPTEQSDHFTSHWRARVGSADKLSTRAFLLCPTLTAQGTPYSTMSIPTPHFLLFSEARGKTRQGQWRFVLQAADGSATFEAEDLEPDVRGDRLELLAVIRGLEALDQPSRVTLFTPSKYVSRGIAYGLEEWRSNGWTWECFGEMVPVKNRDLWQRLDQALHYHTIEFRIRRTDDAHTAPAALAQTAPVADATVDTSALTVKSRSHHGRQQLHARLSRSIRERAESWKIRCGQLGTALLPKPWME
jgi:ribonuclease HI